MFWLADSVGDAFEPMCLPSVDWGDGSATAEFGDKWMPKLRDMLPFRFFPCWASCPERLPDVECDHLFRFLTPSHIPEELPGRELVRFVVAPESKLDSRSAAKSGPNSGLLPRAVDAECGVRDPDREETEGAFLTVTTEEEVELVRVDFLRCAFAFAVELSIINSDD